MFSYLKKTSFILLCTTLLGFTGMPHQLVAVENPAICSAKTLLKKNKKLIATVAALATVCVLLSSSKIRTQAKDALAWTALAVALRFGSSTCKKTYPTEEQLAKHDERFQEITAQPGIVLNEYLDAHMYQKYLEQNPPPPAQQQTSPKPVSPAAQFALETVGKAVEGGFNLYTWWNTPTQKSPQKLLAHDKTPGAPEEKECKDNPRGCGIQ